MASPKALLISTNLKQNGDRYTARRVYGSSSVGCECLLDHESKMGPFSAAVLAWPWPL